MSIKAKLICKERIWKFLHNFASLILNTSTILTWRVWEHLGWRNE